MSVAALGGPNWNVWGSLLNDLCRQGSQSDCKHMERFLRQEKHLYNAERETDRGARERARARERKRKERWKRLREMWASARYQPVLKRNDNLKPGTVHPLWSRVSWNTEPRPAWMFALSHLCEQVCVLVSIHSSFFPLFLLLLLPSIHLSYHVALSNKLLTFCLVMTAGIMGLVSSGMSNK